jgi:hypothetical protein
VSRKVLRVTVYRASPIRDEQVPDLVLTTGLGHVPDSPDTKWEAHHRRIHKATGKRIADALFKTLPGGTVDALLVQLLKRRASLFSVRF